VVIAAVTQLFQKFAMDSGGLGERCISAGGVPRVPKQKSYRWRELAAGVVAAAMIFALCSCGTSPGLTRLSSIPPPKHIKQTVFLPASTCQTCHPAQYAEWKTSMHAYAQHSPVFIAFNDYVLMASGGSLGTFCERCHTGIGTSFGESAIEPNSKRSAVAMEGVTCMTCHSQHKNFAEATGQIPVPVPGDPEPTIYGPYYGYDEPGAPSPSMRLIKSPHKSRYSPLFTSAHLCAACHDVLTPDGFRLEEAYSEWKNGPYARRGIVCEDCHMGPVPGKPTPHSQLAEGYIVDHTIFPNAPKRRISNHSFTGPDYSLLPAFGKNALGLGKKGFARLEQHLDMERETLLRNAATIKVTHPDDVKRGAVMQVAVAVTNSGAGHNLPTGFASERQVWLEVVVTDGSGRQIFISGNYDKYLDLRDYESKQVKDGTVPVDSDLFNLEADFVLTNFLGTQSYGISTTNRLLGPVPFITPPPNPTFLQGFAFAGRVFKEGIPPLKTKIANYNILVPYDATGPLKLSVRLRYRNFPGHFLRDLGLARYVSKLRIVDMNTYEGDVRVIQ
jgi:Cytochrome c554 and c-prime